MKTNTLNNRAYKMAAALCAAIVFGTTILAQPNPESNTGLEVDEAFGRLEVLMSQAEQAARYVAPSVYYDEIRLAVERLEFLANKTASEIRYEAPDIDQSNAEEYAVQEEEKNVKDEDFLIVNNRTKRQGNRKVRIQSNL